MADEHRHFGAVFALVLHLIDFVLRRVEFDFSFPEQANLAGLHVEPVVARRRRERAEAEKCFGVRFLSAESGRGADAGQGHIANEGAVQLIDLHG